MIANFFQSLDHHAVDYLLISGQAAILYGAATFSEDIDLWIDPSADNCERFVGVLRGCGARYYKLTPQFTVDNLRRGHAFHFLFGGGAGEEIFLDVLGAPPRVGTFAETRRSARRMETEWGPVQTIGLKPLVELKKTQRLEDYPIVSRLALAWLDQPECARAASDFHWTLRNIFTLSELVMLFKEHPGAAETLSAELSPETGLFARRVMASESVPEPTAEQINAEMQKQIAALQQSDRVYWHDIIADLKRLRAQEQLAAEGREV